MGPDLGGEVREVTVNATTVLRSRAPDVRAVAPGRSDTFRNDAVLEVISGEVVGAVDRILWRDENLQLETFHMANSLGFDCDNLDSAPTLANLAAVIAITIRSSGDKRDAQTAVLSREAAIV
jgi:hypothetical protein